MIDFSKIKISREDLNLISEIADRARLWGALESKLNLMMDLQVVHSKTPLDLRRLLGADNTNFAHDVFGIIRHLNRDTGELEDCFSPRYTKRETSAIRVSIHDKGERA